MIIELVHEISLGLILSQQDVGVLKLHTAQEPIALDLVPVVQGAKGDIPTLSIDPLAYYILAKT